MDDKQAMLLLALLSMYVEAYPGFDMPISEVAGDLHLSLPASLEADSYIETIGKFL